MDFYSDGTTLSKCSTQPTTIVCVRFSNTRPYSDTCFTIALATYNASIPHSIPNRRRRQLKLNLYHRFLFKVFHNALRASFNGYSYKDKTYFLRIGLVIADKSEERTLHCLKRRDYDMDCTHCVVQSRLRSQSSRTGTSSVCWSDEDGASPSSRRPSSRNNTAQLQHHFYPVRDPSQTVPHQ